MTKKTKILLLFVEIMLVSALGIAFVFYSHSTAEIQYTTDISLDASIAENKTSTVQALNVRDTMDCFQLDGAGRVVVNDVMDNLDYKAEATFDCHYINGEVISADDYANYSSNDDVNINDSYSNSRVNYAMVTVATSGQTDINQFCLKVLYADIGQPLFQTENKTTIGEKGLHVYYELYAPDPANPNETIYNAEDAITIMIPTTAEVGTPVYAYNSVY